jgi:hypothetical protein
MRRLSHAAIGVIFLLFALSACRQHKPLQRTPPPESSQHATPTEKLDAIARSYLRLSLALGERDPDSLDFSTAPQALIASIHQSYPSLDSITRDASALAAQLNQIDPLTLPEQQRTRVDFLQLQLASIQARIAMLHGHTLNFDSEAQTLFATTRLPDTQAAQRIVLRARILALLPAQHSSTDRSSASRYAAYDRRFLIPPTHLAAVMRAALDTCRQHTAAYLTLPPGESVDLTFVRNQPWSAFSRYRGHAHSTIQINLDLPLTIDEALELACHEGYPGHHLFNTLRDLSLVQQRHWPEAQVQLTFSPQSFVSEAAAAYAPRLLFSTAERTQVERDVLFPLAGLAPREAERYVAISTLVRQLDSAEPAIARDYLDGHLEFVRAGQQLATDVLMAHPEASLLYLNEYRSYMLAYTDGPRRLAAYLSTQSSVPPPNAEGTKVQNPIEAQRRAEWKDYERLMRTLQFTLPSP